MPEAVQLPENGKKIVNQFSALLGAKRLKISDVSRKTGISRTTLTQLYYSRECAISYGVLEKLCTALNCDIADILKQVEVMRNGTNDA